MHEVLHQIDPWNKIESNNNWLLCLLPWSLAAMRNSKRLQNPLLVCLFFKTLEEKHLHNAFKFKEVFFD